MLHLSLSHLKLAQGLSVLVRSSVSLCSKVHSVPRQSPADEGSEQRIDFSQLDPNKFGDLSAHYPPTDLSNAALQQRPLASEGAKDDPDGYDKLEIKRGVKKSIEAYMRILNELLRHKPPNVPQMLKLHREFVYEDRYIPDKLFYSVLLEACAQVGFTKKAVELFEEMRMFELKPSRPAVTSLLNACANCTHTKEYGLKQLTTIRQRLELDGFVFNDIHYNVQIKAFARLGDMTSAYSTLQEMTDKGRNISRETYCMLLMGCIGDTKQGLFGATKIISRLTASKRLDLSLLNLFLRCIRDCEIGSENLPLLCSKDAPVESVSKHSKNQSEPTVESENAQLPEPLRKANLPSTEVLPNLLTGANLDNIVTIDYASLSRASNRFLLFGGLNGFTHLFDTHSIQPDLKTISILIDLLQLKKDLLAQVSALLQKYNLKADVFLYNVLIKKFAKAGNYTKCQLLIRQMQSEQIQPDIFSFGALTFCCTEERRAKSLLQDMASCNMVANDKIVGSLITIACNTQNLSYVSYLLNYMKEEGMPLTNIAVEKVDLLLSNVRREIANSERQNIAAEPELNDKYQKVSQVFKSLQSAPIQVPSHPWRQFESSPIVSKKTGFNSFAKFMQQKSDIKMRKDRTVQKVVDPLEEVD